MKKYRIILSFGFVLIIMFTSILLSGHWKDRSNIQRVELSGNMTLSKEELFDFARITDSILIANALTLETIESRISKHPNIKKVNVTRESFTIKIEITEKDPFAVVKNESSIFLVDNELNLYNFKHDHRDIDLPVIGGMSENTGINIYSKTDLKNLKIGRYIISQSMKFSTMLYNYISEIDFSDTNGILIFSSDDATPIHFIDYRLLNTREVYRDISRLKDVNNGELRAELDRRLVYLNNFLKQVRVYKTLNSFEYIDLRYRDMIVVRYKESINNEQ